MTIREAKQLRWGTILRPNKNQRKAFKNVSSYIYRDAIFTGIARNDESIRVVLEGNRNAESWTPHYWEPRVEEIE